MSKWISVEEERPQCGEPVLIFAKDMEGDSLIAVATRNADLLERWSVSGCSGYDVENDFFARDVMFWMPLPKEPEKTNE